MIRTGIWAFVIVLTGCTDAWAQTSLPGRVELGGGIAWLGSAAGGSSDATESTASGGRSTIFKTSTSLGGSAGLRFQVDFRLTKAFELEGLASFGRPTLKTSISSDIEGAAPVTAEETISEYMFGGGILWYVPLSRMPPRFKPFVGGQIAYLRQLHQGDTLAVTGQAYQLGGGFKYFVPRQSRSWLKGYGVRVDVGIAARTKGVFFDDAARFSPVVGAAVFARF